MLTHISRAIQHSASPHLLGDPLQDPGDERGPLRDDLPKYVIIQDNIFHHSHTIRQWFATHYRMLMGFLPPYPQILNPIEELYSAWRWKVYDRQPHTQMTLLAAMDVACEDITVDGCRGWIRHSKRFIHIAREDICCDVDDNLWSDRLHCNSSYSAHKILPKACFLCLPF